MGKDDQMILVVPAHDLFQGDMFEGIRDDRVFLDRILAHGRYLRRGDMEDDPSFKQAIPYCIIANDGKYLVYERTPKGGEARLHGKLSIGFGGHVEEQDGRTDTVLMTALLRELEEELGIDAEPRFLGCVYEDSGVAKVHFGLLYIAEYAQALSSRDAAITIKGFFSKGEILALAQYHDLESWSALALSLLD